MGQQQLLLIVLGVIVVGITTVVGMNLFNATAVESNRTAIIADLDNLAVKAWAYKKLPTNLGGGGNSFVGFTIPTGMGTNSNGTYNISVAGTQFVITFEAIGAETGDDGSLPVRYTGRVTPEKIIVTKLN